MWFDILSNHIPQPKRIKDPERSEEKSCQHRSKQDASHPVAHVMDRDDWAIFLAYIWMQWVPWGMYVYTITASLTTTEMKQPTFSDGCFQKLIGFWSDLCLFLVSWIRVFGWTPMARAVWLELTSVGSTVGELALALTIWAMVSCLGSLLEVIVIVVAYKIF